MKKYYINIKKHFLFMLWAIAMMVSLFDIIGLLVEFVTNGKLKYIGFTDWKIANHPVLLLMCVIVLVLTTIICMFFSYKNIRTDKMKAILIILIPMFLYNVFTYLNVNYLYMYHY